MVRNLFGGEQKNAVAEVRLYADEIKPRKNRLREKWMYIGILAIPEPKHYVAFQHLQDSRNAAQYHREVKLTQLTNRSDAKVYNEKTLLAKEWVKKVMWDREKTFHFYILGLNLSNLAPKAFGAGSKRIRSIYNRFFRTALAYTLKGYFGQNIVVTAIFHDKGDMEVNDFFDWHSIWRISWQEPGIVFLQDRIEFIDSDHQKEQKYPEESHFIQLMDVILGSATQCLDATSSRAGCIEVAKAFLPLMDRLNDPKRASNPHSRYCHFRRCSVSFFPSRKLSTAEIQDPWKRAGSNFYLNRRLLLQENQTGQMVLW